ncbi:MAG TPA: sigma-70 family RNA polymerase sigma factor [Saprospiraceae bacterium]|nr:sigma-70 family RNA polymerase sigma factor [Saprospiraceae bacterium]
MNRIHMRQNRNVVDQWTDQEIVSRIQDGDIELYELIIRRYNPYLFKIGRSYGFNHADTEDLMQETYINAYTHLSTFEFRSALKTWLVQILLHQCYQRKHKRSIHNESPTDLLEFETSQPMFTKPSASPEQAAANAELKSILERAVQSLPESYRLVFSLRELGGLSTEETAGTLGLSESNVKVRLNRAKAMLRQEVEKQYSPAEIYEFNLVYCDSMVERVMSRIRALERVHPDQTSFNV